MICDTEWQMLQQVPPALFTGQIPADEHELRSSGRGFFCSSCGAFIASIKDIAEKEGRHQHAFFNPVGIVYEIRCFRRAPGCRYPGSFSEEFSWFAGYAWAVATCSGCSEHVGWYFHSLQSGGFFGLIANRIVDEQS